VFATNENHTVREFIEETFRDLGDDVIWQGNDIVEVGMLRSSGRVVIKIDPRYFRPTEVDVLLGNPAKAKEKLGWEPKTTFKELVRIMALADYEKTRRQVQ
jgi:GDPmannose 4,6-dehydratase